MLSGQDSLKRVLLKASLSAHAIAASLSHEMSKTLAAHRVKQDCSRNMCVALRKRLPADDCLLHSITTGPQGFLTPILTHSTYTQQQSEQQNMLFIMAHTDFGVSGTFDGQNCCWDPIFYCSDEHEGSSVLFADLKKCAGHARLRAANVLLCICCQL